MYRNGAAKALTYEDKFLLAAQLTKEQQDDKAIKLLSSLIDENPSDPRIYAVMGEAAINRRNFPEAIKSLRLARQLQPENKFIPIRIADALIGLGRYGLARNLLNGIKTDFIGTVDAPLWALGMAEVSRCQQDYKRAHDLLDYCLQEVPQWSVPYGSKAILLLCEHRYTEAVEYMRAQYELKPNWKSAHELGMALPFIDDWKGAYEMWHLAGDQRWGGTQFMGTPIWNGEQCETLKVYGDGGLGDTIQYSRYLLEAKKYCKRLIFSPQPRHLEIVKELNLPGIEIADEGQIINQGDKGDYATWLMVLMGAVELYSPEQSPAPVRFTTKIECKSRIAISWYGDYKHANDKLRSARLEDFSSLILQFPEYEWFTVLPGKKTREDIKKSGLPVKQYEGTLAEACKQLLTATAYVGVDTGHAHVTATQGIETHVILKDFVDSRWGAESLKSGYYSAINLYRSYRDGWAQSLKSIAGRLHETDSQSAKVNQA